MCFRLAAAERRRTEPVDESTVVDDVFGYLDNEEEKLGQADPSAFKDLPSK